MWQPQNRVHTKCHWLGLSLLAFEVPFKVLILRSDLIDSSNISPLIIMKRQEIVLTCSISVAVAEQRSPKGRLHNLLKGEESQRGFGRSPLQGKKQPLCEALPICGQFLSLFRISFQQQKVDLDESCES